MDIAKLSVTELEALAYKQVKLLNQTQSNLAVIEQELARRQESVEPKKAKGK